MYPFFLPLAYWKALQISGMFLNYFKQFGGVGGVEHETIYFIRSADTVAYPYIYIYINIYIFFLTLRHQQPAREVFFYSDIMFKRLDFFIAFKKLLIVFSPKKV